jgi:nucleotide-binding universal stress UspA family protein
VVETSDEPADAIVQYARSAHIDLIVIGTHGRSGLSQLLVGSVAERVVHHAPCPVLTVRQPEHEFVIPDATPRAVIFKSWPAKPACQERVPVSQTRSWAERTRRTMIALNKILVATDFSEPSEAALAYGRALARQFSSTLLVAHVVENVLTGAVGADGFVFTDPSIQPHVDATARKRVESLLSDFDRAVLGAEAVVILCHARPAIAT